MKLRFTAARHYASHGHWTDAYAYVLRTWPDNIPQHEDTNNRNAQAWHYTNARINELIQEVEQILEVQDRQVSEESQFGPPRDSLVPPAHSTGAPSPIGGTQGKEQESREPPETTSTRRVGDKVEELPLSRLILQIKSLRERNETQLLMRSNKLLEPRQKLQDGGE